MFPAHLLSACSSSATLPLADSSSCCLSRTSRSSDATWPEKAWEKSSCCFWAAAAGTDSSFSLKK